VEDKTVELMQGVRPSQEPPESLYPRDTKTHRFTRHPLIWQVLHVKGTTLFIEAQHPADAHFKIITIMEKIGLSTSVGDFQMRRIPIISLVQEETR